MAPFSTVRSRALAGADSGPYDKQHVHRCRRPTGKRFQLLSGWLSTMSIKISVITPSLNSAQYLRDAINSVKTQDYENWEHIVMDGGSTDGTLDILKEHPWVRWVSEPDSGQSNAMNKGFAKAEGDVVVYLNADDYFLPGAFRVVADAFEQGARFVVGDVMVLDLDGVETRVSPRINHREMLRHWEPWAEQGGKVMSPYPNNPVQYFYARDIQAAYPYNENNHNSMDLEFLLRVSREHAFTRVEPPLGVYRLLEDAKNVVAQKSAFDYWTCGNFAYVDDLIADWPPAELQAFKTDQQLGYVTEMHRGNQWAFRPVADAMHTLMCTSLITAPLAKIRAYKALLGELSAYKKRLGQAARSGR